MFKTNAFRLAIAGAISGIFSYFSAIYGAAFLSFYFVPGIIFGFATTYVLFPNYRKTLDLKSLGWLFASVLSYFIAVVVYFHYPSVVYDIASKLYIQYLLAPIIPTTTFHQLIFAGAVGSLLLIKGFHIFIRKLSLKLTILLTLLGSLLSLSWYIIPQAPPEYGAIFYIPTNSILGLYLFWQTGMAGALGWVMDRNEKQTNPAEQNLPLTPNS